MDNNDIKSKIITLYNECEALQQKINSNKSVINSYLQKFVVGSQIGEGVYSDDYTRGYDISLSGNKADYEETMNLINRDIDDIDLIISKHNELKDLMSKAPMDNELLEIGYKALAMIEKMYQERDERVTILNRVKQIYSLLEQQEEEMKHRQSEESASSGGSSGGDYSGSASTSDTSGTSTVGDVATGGDTSSNETTAGSDTSTSSTSTPATQQQPVSIEEYKQALTFNLTSDDMTVAKSNLATHAENTKNILSNVVMNGEVVGGDVYGVNGSSNNSDVGFNFGALQMACDSVSADVSAISAYISQMRDKITSNKAKIESTKAEMDRTETVTVQDEKGNFYTEERKVHSGSEIAAYQAQIDALNAENTQLEADITSYTSEMNQKKEVFNKLMNLRNAYQNAYGGLVNAFTANDLINNLLQSPDGNLMGMSLSDSQKQDLFRNLGAGLVSNQENLSLVTTADFNMSAGEYPLGAYQYLLGCCSILGNTNGTFQENVSSFNDFRKSIASSLGIDLNTVSTGSSDSNVSGNLTQNNSSNQDSTFDKADSTNVGRPLSTKTLAPEVEQFMLSHTGQLATMSSEMKQALGLDMDAMISVPRGYNTTEEWPLLVWLAGTGTAGGSTENLKSSVFVKNIVNGQYTVDGAIMYVPVGWGSGSSEANNSVYSGTTLSHDFERVVNGLNVDKNHISGMGISIGAFALAYLVDAHPNTFSAAAMCGGGFGGPFGDVTVDKAIQNSPQTSFIWYNANNDESSGGVHTEALKSHQALLNAGINSVYYEVGGSIWHEAACDRFVTDAMVNDLINIEKGQRYTVPNDVLKVSPKDAYNASVSHGGKENNWYVPLSSGERKAGVTTLEYREVTSSTLPREKVLPDIFVNVSGAIPDLSANMSTLKDYLTETSAKATAENLASVENGATLQTLQHDGQLIYYYQKGYYDQNGQFHRWQSSWGKDIASAGCGPTSMAACLANMLHDPSITPTTIANMLNYDDNVGGTYVRKAAEYYGLDQTHTIGLDKTKMNNFLRNDGKMIVAVNGGGHYVAVVGIDDSSNPPKYIVNDPNDHDAKLKTWTYYQLAADHTMVFHIAPKGKTVDQCIKEQTYQVL